MNRHTAFLELAAAGIDFRLTGPEQTRLEAHLAACPACRARVEGLHADARSIAGLPEARLDPRRASSVLDAALHGPARSPVPVLRLALVAALVGALAIGAALVGAELLRRMTENDISVVPPVPTASPAPDASPEPLVWTVTDLGQPSGFLDVAVGGPGLVAVGYESWESPTRSVVWTSTDGSSWVPAPDQASLDVGRMSAVASGTAGLIAVGSPCAEGSCVGSSIWRSSDGSSWTAVADPAFELSSITTYGSRYFAGGVGGAGDGAIIASADGETWEVVWEGPPRSPVDGGSLAVRSVSAITPLRGGLAAWVASPGELLLSADGTTWRSEPVGSDATYVDALAAWGVGLLAAGREGNAGAIWMYDEGTWERVADVGPGEFTDIVDVGGALLASGFDGDGRPLVLSSRDGRSWTPEPIPRGTEAWTLLLSMVPIGREVVGVGSTGGTGVVGPERLAVWHRNPGSVVPTASPTPEASASPAPGWTSVAAPMVG
ncbi:MAG TPA: zf-HC2 domain-containing protein, partial [Candidatus Limnocylindrales bacterium]|nr:zf-HC2 domain-containing protein [Candidatus Limnocylindrales bacterium]